MHSYYLRSKKTQTRTTAGRLSDLRSPTCPTESRAEESLVGQGTVSGVTEERRHHSVVGQGSSLPCNIQQSDANPERDVDRRSVMRPSVANLPDFQSCGEGFASYSSENSLPHPYYTLIFDTETTGLFSTHEITSSKLNEYPYMIQLAYELLEETTGEIVESYNSYIQISDTIELKEQIQNITGITKEKLHNQGISISDALVSFYHAYSKSKRVVAHNISFDIKMIQVEIMRNYDSMREKGCPFPENIFNPIYEHIQNKDLFCTMKHGIKIINLWKRSYKSLELPLTENEYIKEITLPNGQIIRTRLEKKFPKLENLYVQIYGVEPKGLHDAKIDVEICRKVYVYLSIYLNLSKVV